MTRHAPAPGMRPGLLPDQWARCAPGGSGQYGRVIGYMEPLPEDAPEKVVFAKEVIGNAIPPQFIPSVEKGFLQACNSGTLIGHPVEVSAARMGLVKKLLRGSLGLRLGRGGRDCLEQGRCPMAGIVGARSADKSVPALLRALTAVSHNNSLILSSPQALASSVQ